MLVDCPTDAATPTDVPFFPSVLERGTADDLTGHRSNSESDACLLHNRTAKRKEQICLHESSRILAMTGPGSQQKSTTLGRRWS